MIGALRPLKLTADQQRAADPGASVWVEASAGTGKTQVLTARVLRLLLGGTAPSRILCLTFTKAAAAEMATRIAERLGLWTIATDDVLRAEIAALGHLEVSDGTLVKARRLFARVLDCPGGMRILTIHAFCQSILQRFPLEAGVPPHFAVLDETEARTTMHEARDELLRAEGSQPAMGDPLACITPWVNEDDFSELMNCLARDSARLKRALAAYGGIEGLAAAIRKRHGVEGIKDEQELLDAAATDGACDLRALRAAAQALCDGSDSEKKRGLLIGEWLSAGPGDRAARISEYSDIYLTQKKTVRSPLVTKIVEKNYPGTNATLCAEAQRLLDLAERRCAVMVAAASEAVARIGAAMLDIYERRKRESGALDYDDLVRHTRELMDRADMVPWVLFKLDGGLDHILIDEAQDTNPEQWDIVKALAAEFYAGIGARDVERSVFAVGDPKQSIFSFQRADPAAFDAMRTHFSVQVQAGGRAEWDEVALKTSFRSTAPVLRLVDSTFAEGLARDGVASGSTNIRHEPERAGHAGLIELWPVATPLPSEDTEPWSPPTKRINVDAPRARLARKIASTIKFWIDSKAPLESRGRSVRAGDVMVLVRRRAKFVDELVRALKQRDVPVAGVDRMVLTQQLAVMDLMVLGDFLLLPEDDLTLATVLKGPLFGFDDARLYEVAYGRQGSLWAALNAAPQARAAVDELGELLARADFSGPYALYAELLGARRGRERLIGRLGHDATDPIDEFMAAALSFEREHEPSLQGFLFWMREGAAEIKRDLDQSPRDEVRVMTVHGAKGLQAPVVILPDTMQVPTQIDPILWCGDDLPIWSPRVKFADRLAEDARGTAKLAQEREYRRLLYVALTRAEDKLYVTGCRGKRDATSGNWYELVQRGAERIAVPMPFDAGDGWVGPALAFDSPQSAEPRDKEAAATLEPGKNLPSWARRPPPPEPAPPRPLTPSAPEPDDAPVLAPIGAQEQRRFRRGLLIHRLLQILPELPADKRRAASAALVKRWARELDADQQQVIATEAMAVLETPDLAPLFGPDSRAEVPIVGTIGTRVIAGQVDRLVVRPAEVVVVDFKTNRPPPRRVEDVSPVYLRQMAAYRAALAKVYPDRAVRCVLLWTDGAFAMTLPDGLLDRADPTRDHLVTVP